MSIKNEFCQIFEIELKRKLSERAKSTIDEIRLLLNSFKFYDLDYIGIIDKIQWVRGILKAGLTGFSENDLLSIFLYYDPNNSGFIDYKNFANYLYEREQLNPLPKKPIIDVFKPYVPYNNNNINNISYNYNNTNNIKNNINIYNNNNNNKLYNIYNNNNFQNNENKYNINNNNYINTPKMNFNITNNDNMSNGDDKLLHKKQISLKEEEMKKFFEFLILKFRNRININNGITFYIFAKKLKSYEVNNKINLNDLIQIFKEMRLDFTENDVKNFFYMMDINQMNFINIYDIINIIKGKMSQERKLHVLNKFEIIDKSKKGEIDINFMKIIYRNNSKYHPDVINGIKTEDIIYGQFRQTLELFLDINKILNEKMTREEFVDYYTGISAAIPDDIYFQDILNGIWDLSKLYNINNNDDRNINKINYNNGINNYDNYMGNNYFQNYNIPKNKYMNKSLSTPEIKSEAFPFTPYNNNNILQKNYKDNNNMNENKRYNNNNTFNNNKNINSISDPYYRPRITPGNKGIKLFKKIIYNPITKELLYSDNNNEQNNKSNENTIKSPMKRYKNNIYLFDEDKYKQQKLIELFNSFRNEIISKGEKTIFTLQKILYEFNNDYHPNLISFDNFCILFQKLNIKNINIEGIKNIFGIFDKNNSGYIDYDYFFKSVVGYMGRNRQPMIRNIYDSIKKDQNGNIFVVDFKKLFNANKYNDIFGGQKTKEYIYYEFIDNLEIFLNYRNKLYNKNLSNVLNYDDFLRFFDQISMYINNDDVFENYINFCWNSNINDYKNNYYSNYNNNRKNRNAMIRTGSQIIDW